MKTEGFTPEEKKSQTIFEAELLKGGAKYDIYKNPEGEERLVLSPTEKQIKEMQLESEKKVFDNLGDYIKFDKRIVLPSEEISKEFGGVEDLKGKSWLSNGLEFSFIDKDGNFAKVNMSIDFNKILSIKDSMDKNPDLKKDMSSLCKEIKKELESYGFDVGVSSVYGFAPHNEDILQKIQNVYYQYNKRIIEENKNKSEDEKIKKFDY